MMRTISSVFLFDDLDRTFWALDFACSAHEAFFRFDWGGFLLLDLEDTHRACVCTCAASGAFSIIYDYFHHLSFLLKPEFH